MFPTQANRTLLTLVVCLSLFQTVEAAQVFPRFTTVALNGDMAVGIPGATLGALDSAQLLSDGEVIFHAIIEGDGITEANDSTWWRWRSDTGLSLLIREGNVLESVGLAYTAEGIGGPAAVAAINGQLLFESLLIGAPPLSDAVLLYLQNGQLSIVAREGQAAPGGPNLTFDDVFFDLRVNAGGQIAFRSSAEQYTVNGIWAGAPPALHLLARQGGAAPGTAALFDRFSSLVLAPTGDAWFGGMTDEVIFDLGLWRGDTVVGGVVNVALTGDIAIGGPNARTFLDFGEPSVNRSGYVAFASFLDESSMGVFVGNSGGYSDVAVSGGGFTSFGLPRLNSNQKVVFLARNESGTRGLWFGDTNNASGPVQVALEGAPLPGTTINESFDLLSKFSINSANQIVFTAQISGSAVSDDNNESIFFAAAGSAPIQIVREGDALEVAPGDFRTITPPVFQTQALFFGLGISALEHGLEDGARTFFNDDGDFVFRALFGDDAQGIFVARSEQIDPIFSSGFENGVAALPN